MYRLPYVFVLSSAIFTAYTLFAFTASDREMLMTVIAG